MATEAQHIAQANRNQDALSQLLSGPNPFSDWIAVIAFYKALHIVEAVFHCQSLKPPSPGHIAIPDGNQRHVDRNSLTKQLFPQIWRDYSHLYNTSLVARYLEFGPPYATTTYSTFSAYMPHNVVLRLLLGRYLIQLENTAAPLLSAPQALQRYLPPPAQTPTPAGSQSGSTTAPPASASGP